MAVEAATKVDIALADETVTMTETIIGEGKIGTKTGTISELTYSFHCKLSSCREDRHTTWDIRPSAEEVAKQRKLLWSKSGSNKEVSKLTKGWIVSSLRLHLPVQGCCRSW